MNLTRRSFFAGATLAGAAPAQLRTGGADGIPIRVQGPAGPPPFGAPVETSVPLARAAIRSAEGLRVFSAAGKPVLTQTRPAMHWPDGSIRWLAVAFEAEAGPGTYLLRRGTAPTPASMVQEQGGTITVDTGEAALRLDAAGGIEISAPDGSGRLEKILTGAELILTRHDGKVFRAALAGATRDRTVVERGPVRACVRVDGQCRAGRDTLFDFIIRWTAYRARPEVFATVTWVNATGRPSEQVRDIRLSFPFEFAPERLVIGCERGVYDGPFLKDWPVYVLQDDHDRYQVRKLNPDGRVQHLSSGGCNGERAPGWLYFQNKGRAAAVWVPNFWQEYPNEIAVQQGQLAVGLWPERAAARIASKPILPPNPDGERPYVKTKYSPVLPHPYVAFFDPASRSMDARQGVAKTQEVVLSVWAGRGSMPAFEKKWWSRSIAPVRGHVAPAHAASSGALGLLSPRRSKAGRFERLFDECFGFLDRHIDLLECYGKFDYGDFKYFTAGTDYMTHPGTKWGHMGEMAREGYWHNNEGDPLLGLLLYYFRTGEPAAWERCRVAARHLLDVDIAHHPRWGMYTHGYGHGYVETNWAGAPDHSWLLGLLLWAGASADPLAWEWVLQCGEKLRLFAPDFSQQDTRTVSVHLHMMCEFHRYTGRAEFLEAARRPATALLRVQNKDGSWPAYMANMKQPRFPGFVDHAIAALADYFDLTGEQTVRKALDAALEFQFRTYPADAALVAYGLAILTQRTGEEKYRALAERTLQYFDEHQNRTPDALGRGQIGWSEWGVNNAEAARQAGRPPQFLGQARPLTPGFTLAYAQPAAAIVRTAKRP